MSQLVEVTQPQLDGLTPRQIVAELDKYIVGQAAAKKSVAIALRNRMRRQFVDAEIRAEIKPKNILIEKSGRARLTDFGSARIEGQTTLTRTAFPILSPPLHNRRRGAKPSNAAKQPYP